MIAELLLIISNYYLLLITIPFCFASRQGTSVLFPIQDLDTVRHRERMREVGLGVYLGRVCAYSLVWASRVTGFVRIAWVWAYSVAGVGCVAGAGLCVY